MATITTTLDLDRRRFPYRPQCPGERAACNEAIGIAINDIRGMIQDQANKFAHRAGWSKTGVEDAVAEIVAHLAVHSAPRFDRVRHTKWSTFAFVCSANVLRAIARKDRAKKKKRVPLPIESASHIAAPDESTLDQIEILAQAIQRDPCAFGFTDHESKAIRFASGAGAGHSGLTTRQIWTAKHNAVKRLKAMAWRLMDY